MHRLSVHALEMSLIALEMSLSNSEELRAYGLLSSTKQACVIRCHAIV